MFHAHCPKLGFFFLATISACAFSCSFELVPPSVDSHNPQQLSPCKLREENFPTVHGYEGYKMSLSLCHHPHPPNWEPGKSLDFSLLKISVSTLDLDHSSSWPINRKI